jgi:cytoskeletal protein CcmA (bactofilin family)
MFSNSKNKRGNDEQPAPVQVEHVVALPPPSDVVSIISPEMTVRGNLKSSGRLRVEGTVTGDIEVDHLVIAAGAEVQGEITVQVAEISGAMTGQIRGRDITLKSSARVSGDIHYEILTMEPKAEFDGQCRRTSTDGRVTDRPREAPEKPEQAVADASSGESP